MKKKTLAVYALMGALTAGTSLTSCIDNDESSTVTQLRDAKAQQLKALAEAELIRANAEAALLNAEAELSRLKAEAQKLENEANKAKYEAEIEAVRAQAELALLEARKRIQDLKNEMDNAAFEHISELFMEYQRTLTFLFELNQELIDTKTEIAEIESGVVSEQAAILKEKMKLEDNLAKDELMLSFLKDPQNHSIDNKAMKEKFQKESAQLALDWQKLKASPTYQNLMVLWKKFNAAARNYSNAYEAAEGLNSLASDLQIPELVVCSFDQNLKIRSVLVRPIMNVRVAILGNEYFDLPLYKLRH